MIKAFSVKSNDYMYVIYVCSMIKSVVSLHNLINNKIGNKDVRWTGTINKKGYGYGRSARIKAYHYD